MFRIYSLSFIFLFLSFNVFSQVTKNSVVPTDILFKKSKRHDFSISPDGKYFAQVIDNNYQNDIAIVDIDGYQLFQRIPIKIPIDNLYWLTSKRLLVEALGEIHAIDVDGNNSVIIVKNSIGKQTQSWRKLFKSLRFNSIIHFLPEKEHQILIQTHNTDFEATINEVNIYTGAKMEIINGTKHKINKWITDRDGTARLGLQYGDTDMKYLIQNPSTKAWEQFYIYIEGEKYPLVVNANSYLSQTISFEGFGYEKDIIYLTTNINSDKRILISYNIKENRVVETLAEDVNCDISDPHVEDIQLIFDRRIKKIAGVRYQGVMPQHKWLNGEIGNVHMRINEKFPNFINDIIDFDYSYERFLIHQWSDNNAGNIGVFDSKDNSYAVMLHFNDELNNYELSRAKSVIATTRDNYKLQCYLNLPPNYSKENTSIPLVVLPHGGPWIRDYYEMEDYSQYFTSRGFATLRVNFRGSAGFGKAHVLAGVNNIDKVMIDDIADATSYIVSNYKIASNKVFIFGHSYGGYATYLSLAKYPDLYAAGVAVSAPTDIRKWMKKQKADKNYFSYEFWNAVLGSKGSSYLSKISPLSYVDQINNPLLIFHGKRDEIIPVEHAEKMIEALKKNNKEAKLEVLQNDDHSISNSHSLSYILDKSNIFFKNSAFKGN